MAETREAVYCTLLLSDSYLPGAMVLAHSLRDNGTKGKIVALVTIDSLHTSTVEELKTIYDDIIPVNRFTNSSPANLYLMDRPDLISAFTKIELWRQTQYSKIVYLDADIVALRAPDELLTLDKAFAAVPDIGWPDCFNTGVMVLTPNLQDYYSLLALAQRGISFDGADQGLLNMHFRDWDRLSFTYNCTPSGNYQYLPAYRHFQSTISMVHYIGQQKPWNMDRQGLPYGGPYRELLGKWWEVYDRHYRPTVPSHESTFVSGRSTAPQTAPPTTGISQQDTWQKATSSHESQNAETYTAQPPIPSEGAHITHHEDPVQELESTYIHTSAVPQYVRGEQPRVTHKDHYVSLPPPPPSYVETGNQSQAPHVPWISQAPPSEQHHHVEYRPLPPVIEESVPEPAIQEQRPISPPRMEWDASRAPPPVNSKPEASSLPTQSYTMSQDTKLFQPPESYPEAPKNMYYEVPPVQPTPIRPRPIFPWEEHAPKPTRVFLDESGELDPEPGYAAAPPAASGDEPSETDKDDLTPTKRKPSIHPWQSYSLSNAWDEVPEIERYVQAIHQSRKAKSPGNKTTATATSSQGESAARRPSMKLTDFPTELERPSLPVTPAPIRRSSFWGQEQEESAELPAAEGVPKQEDWNPVARLEELQRRQVEFFENEPLDPREEYLLG